MLSYSSLEHEPDQHSNDPAPPQNPFLTFPPTCKSHNKTAKSICVSPNCTNKLLCMWDLKNHEHHSTLYSIDQVSEPKFLEELFSQNNLTEKDLRGTIKRELSRSKEKIDLMFNQMKKKIYEKLEEGLAKIEAFRQMVKLRAHQGKWIRQKRICDLEKFVKDLHLVINGENSERILQSIDQIPEVYAGSKELINRVSSEICEFFGKRIESIDALPFSSIAPRSASALLLDARTRQLSISGNVSLFIPFPSQVNNLMYLLRKMTIYENNKKQGEDHPQQQSIFSQNQTFQEDRPSWLSSPERKKDWNFGLGSRNTLGKISLPGTVYWDGERKSLMGSLKREKDLMNRPSVRESEKQDRWVLFNIVWKSRPSNID